MAEIQFKSTIDVEEIQPGGADLTIFAAAKVLHPEDYRRLYKNDPNPTDPTKLLGFLIEKRHGTPFEHGLLTVHVHAPIKVWREWHRHRVGMALHEDGLDFSFNEESGRYKRLEPVFYIPPPERPMIRPEGFRSMDPSFELADPQTHKIVTNYMKECYGITYASYEHLLGLGVDRGLARDVLGVGIYSACWVTANPRSIMSFLELRTNCPEAKRPSKPLWEIDNAARQLETIFARYWPITWRLWNENGRMAP